ncbi:asparagine synthase (glutamine-hydrolyzing) [Geofilum rubicundum]|uniref:asparagine synthase (glutamine-hydrolyzing) n=1 Tax=Geofilum rubicundum JCM 15548 TaxID=1236989 RepID=A0A0E9M3H3_9BACT|nr:asparagine synthase (glutamine-hydrolyzing) [Geofilum rubicundum]GAO31725.1 asparagine synthetase [Geofilum rubicundum JCM 15548]
MCGINGIISSHTPDKQAVIQRMNQRLSHRGPDDEGQWIEGPVALGHRRLSIIDLSAAGHQPMVSACGRYVMVYNGEVYNFQSLRQSINYPYQSNTDSEVILAAWVRYGKASVKQLEGMFAIAVWDKQEQVLTLVRDRMGVKPLYWCNNGQGFGFSSEVRALLASGLVEKEISESALVDYLRYQTVQTPATLVKDIYMVPPATLLQYFPNSQHVSTENYWDIRQQYTVVPHTYEEVKATVRQLFFKAVEKRLVADVPFGAFLSGGIDSSAVVGAMAQLSTHQVKTFNISFAEEAFSEAKYARHIAQMHGTDHHEIKLSPDHFLEHLPAALKAMDHPSGDGPNTWMVSKVTKAAGIDMALSGLGGDEVFGGYAIFKRMAQLEKMQALWRLPLPLRKVAGKALTNLRPGVASAKMADLLALPGYEFNKAYAFSRQVLMDKQIGELLTVPLPSEHLPVAWLNQNGTAKHAHNQLLSRVSVAEMETYMQTVLLRDSDQMSMAHALELRVPFMDHQLIEFVLALPDGMKFPVTPKKLLVDSLPDLLPHYIVNRPKMGFVFPWEHWLKNELHSYAQERIHKLAQQPPFNQQAVLNLWEQFLKGNPAVTFSRIWPLVVLAEWSNS